MRIWPTEFNPVTKLDNSLLNTQFFTEMDWFLDRNYTMYKKVQKDYLLRLPRTKLKIIYSNYRCRTVFLLLMVKMSPISSQFFLIILSPIGYYAQVNFLKRNIMKKRWNSVKIDRGCQLALRLFEHKQLPPAWHWKQRRAYNPLNIKVAYIF